MLSFPGEGRYLQYGLDQLTQDDPAPSTNVGNSLMDDLHAADTRACTLIHWVVAHEKCMQLYVDG